MTFRLKQITEKSKTYRQIFDEKELFQLEMIFDESQYTETEVKQLLAAELGVTGRRILN
jgi:hypothetical protein